MPLQIVRNDIAKMKVDAIVNAANESLLGGGGVDGCIHRAAGPALLEECRKLGGCKTGSAKVTGAGNLPCKYVIHTVGPVWHGGRHGEHELLVSCYRTSLALAAEKKCESVAFPLISSGIYGYPKDQALHTAVETIGEFLLESDMTVYIVVFDRSSYQISETLYRDISEYIDDKYADAHSDSKRERMRRRAAMRPDIELNRSMDDTDFSAPCDACEPLFERPIYGSLPDESKSCLEEEKSASLEALRKSLSLPEELGQIDESFSEMLLRKIDESGMTDAECYKKANIDRKLFSKIRSDRMYRPSKPTVIAFALALELSLDETKEMLMKAGFALSHSYVFDKIIEYFIEHGEYNVFTINETLFAFDQTLLGA